MDNSQDSGIIDSIIGKVSEGAQTVEDKARGIMDFMTMAVQGAYYDSQATKLGLDPKDPTVVTDLEKRLKTLQDTPIEDYMAITGNDTGSLGVQAARKKNQEKALADLLDFYARKHTPKTKSDKKSKIDSGYQR
jgi:hypothetical protein